MHSLDVQENVRVTYWTVADENHPTQLLEELRSVYKF